MSLIVENGSGLASAESYVSVSDASAFHTSRGNAAWAALASDTIREQLLRKATDYMLQVYSGRWNGYRSSSTQALDWPRIGVERRDVGANAFYPSDVVPALVANACADLALRAATAALIPDETQAVKRKRVGSVEIEYQDYSRATKTYRAVDNLLAPFMGAGGGLRVLRA